MHITSNRQKLIACILVAFCCFLVVCLNNSPSMADENTKNIAPKKIVSIVYDDSRSMLRDDRAIAANYATQAFAALMNPQDELYITYMSDLYDSDGETYYYPKNKETGDFIELKDVNSAVETIKTTANADGRATPLRALEVGLETLTRINETNPNTQFWLVIMTDGMMQNIRIDDFADSRYDTLIEALDSIKNTTMSNGTSLHIYYFGIGSHEDETEVIDADPDNHLEAVNEVKDIVPELGNVANAISGRLKYDASEITVINPTTIAVHSDMALYSLSAFSQNSSAKVVSAVIQDANGQALNIDRNVTVWYEYLYGNIAVMDNGANAIPAGDYLITFSENIDINSIVVMYQPAINLRIDTYVDGNVVDTDSIERKDTVGFYTVPVDPYTGAEIDPGILPYDTGWEVTLTSDGSSQKVEGRYAEISSITAGTYTVEATVAIPGMIPIGSEPVTFTIEEYTPDIGIHMTIHDEEETVVFDNLQNINNLSGLEAGDIISVFVEAYDKNPEPEIASDELFAGGNWNIDYQIDGTVVGNVQENIYDNILVELGNNAIMCRYDLGGQYSNSTSVSFEVKKIKLADRNERKQIVAIVYDDSESMAKKNDSGGLVFFSRASLENYAVQLFASLLNEQDELSIAYMSDANEENAIRVCNLSEIESTIKEIADSGTPDGKDALNDSIKAAVDSLSDSQEADPETQFWLLIITDGEMDPEVEGYDSINEILDPYKGLVMSNGTMLNTYYLDIGGDASEAFSDPDNHVIAVGDVTNIVDSVQTASETITERDRYESADIVSIDDNTLMLTLDQPVNDLVLYYDTLKTVVSVETDSDQAESPALDIENSVRISKGDLFGYVTSIANGEKMIPAGNIKITFSGKMDPDAITVAYQAVTGGTDAE